MSASGARPAGLRAVAAAGAAELAEGDGVGAGLGDRVPAVAERAEVGQQQPVVLALGGQVLGGGDDPDRVRAGTGHAGVGGGPHLGGEPEVLGGLGQVLREVGGDLLRDAPPRALGALSRSAVSLMVRVSTWAPHRSR